MKARISMSVSRVSFLKGLCRLKTGHHASWPTGKALIPGVPLLLIVALFCTEPVSRPRQLLLGSVFTLFAWMVARSSSRWARATLVLLSLVMAGRYFWWRMTETVYGTPLDWAASVMLLLVEMYAAVMTFLGYFVMVNPLRRPSVPLPTDETHVPTVDVFIPVYNESLEVIRPTIVGATLMDYPPSRFRVWVLDDGRREEVRQTAEDLGVGYLTRPDNTGAKAGNLNNALARTNGELVAVFDCDHIPMPAFLKKTAGFFVGRPDLAIVQTPHHFYSRDPFERNLGLGDEIPNESDLFYHVIQPGMDLWNSSYFCGSAGILRRSSLEKAGGFRTETVTEDAHTSLVLHSLGYQSFYLAETLVTGLAPETMRDLINQRVRWCRGMIQIFRIDNPLFKKGLSWPQKLCYMNAIVYWLFSVPRIFFLFAPLLYIYFRIYSVHASLEDMLLYLMPYLLIAQGTSALFYRSRRSSLWSIVYEIPLSFYLVLPALMAFLFPRRGRFNVTPKGTRNRLERLDFPVARPAIVLFAVNVGGLVMGVHQFLTRPGGHSMLLMNLFWTIFNILLIGLSLGAMIERRQVRRFPRIAAGYKVVLGWGGPAIEHHIVGRARDLSIGGIRIGSPLSETSGIRVPDGQTGSLTVFTKGSVVKLPVVIVRQKKEKDEWVLSAKFASLTKTEESRLVGLVFAGAIRPEKAEEKALSLPVIRQRGIFARSVLQIERFLDSI